MQMNSNEAVIRLEELDLWFGEHHILDHITMEFWEGHIHAVVGPNGAGKSTLAQTIMGLPDYRDHQGKIFHRGREIHMLGIDKRAQKGITLAWQEPARFQGIGVDLFIRSAGKAKGGSADPGEMLSLVGLDPDRYLKRDVDKTLSGGERKRIELASIVAMKPDVVLMDEPDSGVDIEAVHYIFDVMEKLKSWGTTVILITHSAEVLKHSDHAFLLCNGQVVDKGSVDRMTGYFTGHCVPCIHKNHPDPQELAQGSAQGRSEGSPEGSEQNG